jgi:HEAT repeat protein
MFAYRNAVCLPFITERRALAGTWGMIAWTAAALVLSAAGPAGLERCVEAGEAQIEPTYDGRTMDEWKRLVAHDLSQETRAQAMEALAAFARAGRSEEAIATIASALEQPQSDKVIRAGYKALVRLAPAADPLLLQGLKSQRAETRQIVVDELGSYAVSRKEGERAVPENVLSALIQATEDADPGVRAEACHALGLLVSRKAAEKSADRVVAALVKALGDEAVTERNISGYRPTSVQSEACRALGRCGARAAPAVPALIELVQREVKREEPMPRFARLLGVQRVAIQALGEIGPAAEAAIPVLEALDDNSNHRMEAHRALSQIRGRIGDPRFPLPQRREPADASND